MQFAYESSHLRADNIHLTRDEALFLVSVLPAVPSKARSLTGVQFCGSNFPIILSAQVVNAVKSS